VAQPVVNALHLRLFFTAGIMLSVVLLSRTGGVVGLVRRLWSSARRELAARPVEERAPVRVPRLHVGRPASAAGMAAVRLRIIRKAVS
jgi:hypothetical protein